MSDMPESVRRLVRRLRRRLALGVFLDVWPIWASGSLLLAGLVTLFCRMLFPGAAAALPWLWFAPLAAVLPACVLMFMRAYRPAEVVALADSLGGGRGMLLAMFEHPDRAWADSPQVLDQAAAATVPRLDPWRRLLPLGPAIVFLAATLYVPQRQPASAAGTALADEITADLTATVAALKEQELITPAEEERLEEQIERIRRDARERMDPSSWEGADALREQIAAGLAEKQDAVKWAEDALNRLAAAAEAGGGDARTGASAAELAKALQTLARGGVLPGASEELQRALASGKLPTGDALRALVASMAKQLAAARGRLGGTGQFGRAAGRFNPEEFPLEAGRSADGDGPPGRGGINRGRGDAPLTWGQESQPLDRFKAQALPPGAARSPDDWSPVVRLPGAPEEAATLSTQSEARDYAAATGQTAWRRSLAPRHQSAVRKYFAK
jgi:hypothetical protein